MLAPEGTRSILAATFVGLVLAGGGVALGGWALALVAVGALVVSAALWVHRDPDRVPPPDADRLLLAPADGTVVEIAQAEEPVYLAGPARRVTIVRTALDVHVDRSPATGTVEQASTVREGAGERRRLGLRHDAGVRVLVEQLAPRGGLGGGLEAGDRLSAGQRLGLAPLGTRTVVAVPLHIALDVEVGQRAVAGETVIGRLSSSPGGDGVGRLSEAPILTVA